MINGLDMQPFIGYDDWHGIGKKTVLVYDPRQHGNSRLPHNQFASKCIWLQPRTPSCGVRFSVTGYQLVVFDNVPTSEQVDTTHCHISIYFNLFDATPIPMSFFSWPQKTEDSTQEMDFSCCQCNARTSQVLGRPDWQLLWKLLSTNKSLRTTTVWRLLIEAIQENWR